MVTADGLSGLVTGGVAVSVYIKIEENECQQFLTQGTWLEPLVPPSLSYNRTTTNPHNPPHVVHKWY